MARRRAVEEFEFEPPDGTDAVVDWMDRLAAVHDGWINLLPGVPEEEAQSPSGGGVFSALFGTAQPPVSMCTWVPVPGVADGRAHGRRPRGDTVGIMHARGPRAVDLLASAGTGVPPGWTVRQDHVRRGLIVHPDPGAGHPAVLAWMLAAGAALTVVPRTGRWLARVYLPR